MSLLRLTLMIINEDFFVCQVENVDYKYSVQ